MAQMICLQRWKWMHLDAFSHYAFMSATCSNQYGLMDGLLEELEIQQLHSVSQSTIYLLRTWSLSLYTIPRQIKCFIIVGAVASANGSALAKIGCTVSMFLVYSCSSVINNPCWSDNYIDRTTKDELIAKNIFHTHAKLI